MKPTIKIIFGTWIVNGVKQTAFLDANGNVHFTPANNK